MNPGLGFLVELLAFAAAASLLLFWRSELPATVTEAMLAALGAAMGAGALLFQDDVSLVGGILSPILGAVLVAAHVRGLEAMGVTLPTRKDLPAWIDIPPLRRRAAYAIAPTTSPTIEEPVAQSRSVTEPEPEPALDPDPELEAMPELDEELA
ncbi:MAG TPA: hypothetical protein VFQ40_00870, partial [Actinomycetota bacterium]|nr:hypothetical protein [Actinomycetota bacterium]